MDESLSPHDTALVPAARYETTPAVETDGRNAVFGSLVQGDNDIAGLVAYSVFKQNELDWLTEFRKAKGRDPTETETDSYIIGESTPRRLATYRHLAEATLAGNGPDVAGVSAGGRSFARTDGRRGAMGGGTIIAYVAIGLVILIGVYLAARFGGIPGK
jgi:hypothetical protein